MPEWTYGTNGTYERRRSAWQPRTAKLPIANQKKHAPIHRFYLVWCLGDLIAPIAGAETTEADDIGARGPNGAVGPIRGYARSGTRFPNADTPTRSFPLDSREKTAKINQHIPDYDSLNRF